MAGVFPRSPKVRCGSIRLGGAGNAVFRVGPSCQQSGAFQMFGLAAVVLIGRAGSLSYFQLALLTSEIADQSYSG